MLRGIPIRWLLIGANLLALSLPVSGFFGLRIYDTYLLRQTERQLIAQAVLIGEAWRDALYAEGFQPGEKETIRPPHKLDARFVPIHPLIDIGTSLLPPQPDPPACEEQGSTPFKTAAQKIQPLLIRAQIFNLSAIRILDNHGCVVATTRSEQGLSLAQVPEVQRALEGAYSSVTRERFSDEPAPPLFDVRRRGTIRVFAALPVFNNGEVIGVIRVSRTSLSALRSLWLNRRGLLFFGGASVFFMMLVSLLFAKAITRPLRRLRADARAIVEGRLSRSFDYGAWTPVEFKALADSLAVMTQKLQERAEYTSSYAANVTHELKSPITSIRGAAELLIDGLDSMAPEQRSRFLHNIESDALRMERLVNQLLELTRIENAVSDQEDDAREPVKTLPFFRELISRYESQVTLEESEPPEIIQINPDHLTSAITNLIDNALEQDAQSQIEVRIATSTDSRLSVHISDDGPGIPEAHQDKIFDRFFTTKKDEGGTGLGLAFVKAIAEAQGGSVSVSSDGVKTKFVLIL